MRRSGWRVTTGGLTLLLILVVTACGGGGGSADDLDDAGAAEPVGEITLGVGPDAAFGAVLAGIDQGFFEKHGVEAEISVFPSAQESLEALLADEVDFSGNGQFNVPIVAAEGGRARIIAEMLTSDEFFGVAASEEVQTPEDLAGRSVATLQNTSPHYYLELYLEHHGLSSDDVDVVDLPFPQHVPALAAGDIDAFFAFDPHLSRALDSVDGAHILHYSGHDGIMPLRLFTVVSESVYEDVDLAEGFLRGLAEASEWANDNPDAVAALLSDEFEIELEESELFVSRMHYQVGFDDEASDELERVSEFVVERGIVDSRPELSEFMELSFLESVLAGDD